MLLDHLQHFRLQPLIRYSECLLENAKSGGTRKMYGSWLVNFRNKGYFALPAYPSVLFRTFSMHSLEDCAFLSKICLYTIVTEKLRHGFLDLRLIRTRRS